MKSKDDLISEADSSRKLLDILSHCEEARKALDSGTSYWPFFNGKFGSDQRRKEFLEDWLHEALTYLENKGVEHGIVKPEKPAPAFRSVISVGVNSHGPVKKRITLNPEISASARKLLCSKGGTWELVEGKVVIHAPNRQPLELHDEWGTLLAKVSFPEPETTYITGVKISFPQPETTYITDACVDSAVAKRLFDVGGGEGHVRRLTVPRKAPAADDPSLEWNSASSLPPVACELLLDIDGTPTIGFRTSYVSNKDSSLAYRLADNTEVVGRFRWTYP